MFKRIRHTAVFWKALGGEPNKFKVSIVQNEQQLSEAKELHAAVFLAKGYVSEADLTSDGKHIGLTEDPYQTHSQYFIVERNHGDTTKVVASARLILSDERLGHRSFQTYEHQELLPKYRQLIERELPSSLAEVSGLVKDRSENTIVTLLLYRAMWQYSLVTGHRYWLMSCDDRLYKRLKLLFGNTLVEAGKRKFFKGHTVVPVILDVPYSVHRLLRVARINPLKRRLQISLVRFFLAGVDQSVLSDDQKRQLKRHKVVTRIGTE